MNDIKEVQKRGVGRPRIPDSRKVLYQRVPLEYVTYKKLLALKEKSEVKVTFTELIEALIQNSNTLN
jgi:hypothetical protein